MDVTGAESLEKVLALSGLDWNVYQQTMIADNGIPIDRFRANIRNIDDRVFGIVTDKYRVVQNEEAFTFTDELLKCCKMEERHI